VTDLQLTIERFEKFTGMARTRQPDERSFGRLANCDGHSIDVVTDRVSRPDREEQ